MKRVLKRTPEEMARREKISEMLKATNVNSMEDIQQLFRETIAQFMENGLQSELDEELGYDRYDQSEKTTDNSRNGYSSKTLKTSFGDTEIAIPRDRKGEFDPQILKKTKPAKPWGRFFWFCLFDQTKRTVPVVSVVFLSRYSLAAVSTSSNACSGPISFSKPARSACPPPPNCSHIFAAFKSLIYDLTETLQ